MVSTLELVGPDAGTPVTTTNGALVTLGGQLVEGAQYQLRVSSACSWAAGASWDAGTSLVTSSFVAGPATPLPTSIGEARVDYQSAQVAGRYGLQGQDGFVVATGGPEAVVAQITISPSAELVPFLAVTAFTTLVDGTYWGESFYGTGVSPHETQAGIVSYRDFLRVYASCGRQAESAACESPGVGIGRHAVEVQAHVAGAASDPPPLMLSIDLACSGDAGVDAAPDAPMSDTQAPDAMSSPDDGGSMASPGDAETIEAGLRHVDAGLAVGPAHARTTGCSSSPRPPDRWAAWMLIAFGASFSFWRRRGRLS